MSPSSKKQHYYIYGTKGYVMLLNYTPVLILRCTPGTKVTPQISDLRPQTSDLRSQISDLRPQISDLRPQTSDLRSQTSDLRPQTTIYVYFCPSFLDHTYK